MTRKIYPVILCGGSGSRLWPLSRAALPKQLLALAEEASMLQSTVARVGGTSYEPPILVCNSEQRFMVAEQMREIGVDARIVLEPSGRNTAPAIAVAALHIAQLDPEALVLVLPSDHVVRSAETFMESCAVAARLAAEDHLVTFGIVPAGPETGYGYIVPGKPLIAGSAAYEIDRFVEKPDVAKAAALLEEGCYWNSGMFMFSVRKGIDEFSAHAPEVLVAARKALELATRDLDFLRLDEAAFGQAPALPFDVAVMERTSAAAVVPAAFEWSDVGSWHSLWEVTGKDGAGNVLRGDVMATRVNNSYVRAEHRFVAVLGIDDAVVVETADAVLVAGREASQEVRRVVAFLEDQKRAEHQFHRRVHRPWGWYEEMDAGERFKVKRIMVKPGAAISLQLHHRRAEHWVVVAGTARVRCGDSEFDLLENESTYIPIGEVHRLSNPGDIPLHIVEVQSGEYLAEDDIVRLQDDYGRGVRQSQA